MDEKGKVCPKCKGKMQAGMVTEYTCINGLSVLTREAWVESVSKGLLTRLNNPKIVDTYRCTKCGFLECYATKDPTPSLSPGVDVIWAKK